MARSVADAAAILTVIAGRDPLDNFTLAQPAAVPDFRKALVPNGLKGVRLGVPRLFFLEDQNIEAAFNATLDVIRGLGATVIDPAEFPAAKEILASGNETIVLRTDLKVSFFQRCLYVA
jgi:amidase